MEVEKILRLKKWLRNDIRQPPYKIEVRVTSRCNLNCLSCWRRGVSYDCHELSTKKWIEIIKEAGKFGIKKIEIIGNGESMYRPTTTLEIMKEAKKHKMIGFLLTNGTLFNKEFVKKIVNMGWDSIGFSLDGPDVETNDYLRGMKTFEKVTETINLFNKLKKSSKNNKPFIILFTLLTSKNYDKLSSMVKLAHQLEIKEVYLQALKIESKSCEDLRLSKNMLKQLPNSIREANEISRKLGIRTNFNKFLYTKSIELGINPFSMGKFLSVPCFLPWFFVGIRPNGNVGPCPTPLENEENLEGKSLKQIWFGDNFNEFRKSLMNLNLPQMCKTCCGGSIFENMEIREELEKLS